MNAPAFSLQSLYANTAQDIDVQASQARHIVAAHTKRIDDFLQQTIRALEAQKQAECPFALVATGGYGRFELSYHSDIDLLFLCNETEKNDAEPWISQILYPLWDAKINVGSSLRTPKDCLADAKNEQTFFTSLLENRFLCGNSTLYQNLLQTLKHLQNDSSFMAEFFAAKKAERASRLKRFGGSVYLLEPNIKEGEGGLRDIHVMRWMTKALGWSDDFPNEKWPLTMIQKQELNNAFEFMLHVRNLMHRAQDKKRDQLTFALQTHIANLMNYHDTPKRLAVEQFMQDYYTHANTTSRLCKIFFAKIAQNFLPEKSPSQNTVKKIIDPDFYLLKNEIFFSTPGQLAKNPHWLMKIFWHIQNEAFELHHETLEEIEKNLHLITDTFRENPEICSIFLNIMKNPKNLGQTFFAMHEARVFENFIPEFKPLRNRVQHDVYHVFTVDTHSIFALEELTKLASHQFDAQFPVFKDAFNAVHHKDVLALAILLHDIGKGHGGNHSSRGAVMARSIATRLGHDEKKQDDVEFLVLAHLLLSHISQRRDLNDSHLISELAQTLKTMDRLNMLFVLTWADIRAVSKEAWTDWKGTLLVLLYQKLKTVLENSDLSFESTEKRIETLKQNLLHYAQELSFKKHVADFLQKVPARYLPTHTTEEILEHVGWIEQNGESRFFVKESLASKEHFSEIWILSSQQPHVLSHVTGVMLSLGINILGLEVFQLATDLILLKLSLQNQLLQRLPKSTITRLSDTLELVLTGKKNVQTLIAKQKKPDFLLTKPIQNLAVHIDLDNDVSPYYTVIDVYAFDRMGLLHDMLRALTDEGCYVEISKISTKVDQVVDTFYVKDITGQKILSHEKLKSIQKKLQSVVQAV